MQPFHLAIPEETIAELRARVLATRWPATMGDDGWAYGVPVAYMRELAEYWADGFEWPAAQAQVNELPQFMAEIDGQPIHFVHVRGKAPNPTPLILTHGWPWTVWDFASVIGPLTDPESHGGDGADAFDVVAPSLPGYAFSSPLARGANIAEVAELWQRLMRDELGYERFIAQGGDWGALVSAQLGHAYPDAVLGVHLSMPNVLSVDFRRLQRSDYAGEEHLYDRMRKRLAHTSHLGVHATNPQTLAIALEDSSVGLASWLIDRRRNWSDPDSRGGRTLDRDHLLTTATIYWATNTIGSSMRFYWENRNRPWRPARDGTPVVAVPTAIAVFPYDLIFAPRRLAEERMNLTRWTEMPRGGHFAHVEEPELLVDDVRSFARSLRGGLAQG